MDTYRAQLERRIAADINDFAAHHQLLAILIRSGETFFAEGYYEDSEVFKYMGAPASQFSYEGSKPENYCKGRTIEDVDPKDIIYVPCFREGCNDEEDWVYIGATKNGVWFYVEAGCDYTGWG